MPQKWDTMTTLTDKQLTELGFKLNPIVNDDDMEAGFSYRIAEIKTPTSFIEVVNEYRNGTLTEQFCNYEIIEDGSRKVDVELIKKLKQVIL